MFTHNNIGHHHTHQIHALVSRSNFQTPTEGATHEADEKSKAESPQPLTDDRALRLLHGEGHHHHEQDAVRRGLCHLELASFTDSDNEVRDSFCAFRLELLLSLTYECRLQERNQLGAPLFMRPQQESLDQVGKWIR